MITFKRIGLALAFSPTAEAMLAESTRLKRLFHAELVLVHIGVHTSREDELLKNLLQKSGLIPEQVTILWQEGDPASQILAVCKREKIDLLVAGALKREKLVKYYVGTIARKIMRKAGCSLMMVINPSAHPRELQNIVVNAEDSPFVEQALQAACLIGSQNKESLIHIVRELKLYGLAMSAAHQHSEEEYTALQQHLMQDEINVVEKMLVNIPHDPKKLNIKMLSGKSGFELSKYAARKQADLLVVGAPAKRFSLLDRMFPHDLEYVFADMPCNLLIVQPGKEEQGG